ncbi:hypothetical protein BA6E_10679 [Bacteroidales bacterium 6E]|nr:hypothetical protein BA6E_10679 [Bacteroidales bacterium 6E]
MKQMKWSLAILIFAIIAMTGCNTDENSLPEGKGRLNVHLTDAPFPIQLVSSTWVTIDRVEIRKSSEANVEDENSSFITIAEGEMEFDLLELTNGITEELASVDLEPGSYDMIRLRVVDSKVTLNNGEVYDLKVPSGSASGLKIKIHPAIMIEAGQTSDVLLDFDVSKSFVAKGNVAAGNIIGFNFKPVVRGVYLGAAGRIQGSVTDSLENPLANARVKLLIPENEIEPGMEDEDLILVSSFTDEMGNFRLIGLHADTYTTVCELPGFKNDTVFDIPVTAGASTTVNFVLEAEPSEP